MHMLFEQKVDPEVALNEVNNFLDKKKMYPKRREALSVMIDIVAEAVTYGHVIFEGDGKIVQILIEPILDKVTKEPAITKLEYKARVSPEVIAAKISALKANTQDARVMAYACEYTSQPAAMINKLESTDRNTCDAISLFLI